MTVIYLWYYCKTCVLRTPKCMTHDPIIFRYSKMPCVVKKINTVVNFCRDDTILCFGIIFNFFGTQKINFMSPIMSLYLMLTISTFADFHHHGITSEVAYLQSEGECCCKSMSIPCTSRGRVHHLQSMKNAA